MKNLLLLYSCLCFAFANIYAQDFQLPKIAAPEAAFYTYLDNEHISDPTKYNGTVKKVTRVFKELQNEALVTIQRKTMYVTEKNILEKTVSQMYSFGIEDFREEILHSKTPKTSDQQQGNLTIKTVKQKIEPDEFEDEIDLQGDDRYVFKNNQIVAFFTNNDSISYVYDLENRLVEIKKFESLVAEEYDDEVGSTTYYRSEFEDRFLERVRYENGIVQNKEVYSKFGEVIDIYKTNYTYTKDNHIEKFQTVYKRYLYDYYDGLLTIEAQPYEEFPIVETIDSIQTGAFQYSKSKKIISYSSKTGLETEDYKIHYDTNDRMHLVEGTLKFIQKGKQQELEVEYEYLYGEKGNPRSIRSYYYAGGEKILHRETTFEIEYY